MANAQKGRSRKSPEQKNPVGRPRKFSTPEEFDALVDLYILSCQDPEKPKAITLTGMVLALGFSSKDTLYEYQKIPEFTDSVKRARLLVEQEYENRLILAGNPSAHIFALKNFGWTDKQPTYLDELQAKKLERELQIGDDGEVQPAVVNVGVKDARKH